jgi:hypothetical protein
VTGDRFKAPTHINTTDEDRTRGYNRAEHHLRQHVTIDDSDMRLDRYHGWREDSYTPDRTLWQTSVIARRYHGERNPR